MPNTVPTLRQLAERDERVFPSYPQVARYFPGSSIEDARNSPRACDRTRQRTGPCRRRTGNWEVAAAASSGFAVSRTVRRGAAGVCAAVYASRFAAIDFV